MASSTIMANDGSSQCWLWPGGERVCAALLFHAAAMATEDAVSPQWEEFYLGSRRFMFVADSLGMPIDQVKKGLCVEGLSREGGKKKAEK